MRFSRSLAIKAAAGALVLAAAGTASIAHAGSNVYFSVGAVTPGVSVAASNYGYVTPAPVYVAPAPVYVAPPVVVRAAPVIYPSPYYYGRPAVGVSYYYGPAFSGHSHRHGGHWGHNGGRGGHGGHARGGHAGHWR